MNPSEWLNALYAGLVLNNLGSNQTIELRYFRMFYDEGMEPIWMLVYDVTYHADEFREDQRHERRMAMGQGSRLHMDSIAKHMKGW